MKRKYFWLVLFLVVVCLLSFVGNSYSDNEVINPREWWNRMSDWMQESWIMGFQEGINMSLSKLGTTVAEFEPGGRKSWDEIVALYNFMIEQKDCAILYVTNDLYKDPANSYIYPYDMVNIACHKLQGEDIELLLQKARKEGLQRFKWAKGID